MVTKNVISAYLNLNDSEVTGHNNSINGDYNKINGSHDSVYGYHNDIHGDYAFTSGYNNYIVGNHAKMEVIGSTSEINSSPSSITGDNYRYKGDNGILIGDDGVVIGDHNHISDNNGGTFTIKGANNYISIDKSDDITFLGKKIHNLISSFNEFNANVQVNGFINGDQVEVSKASSISFVYHDNNTMMSIDDGNNHTEMLFTNSHVTSKQILLHKDEKFI